LISNKLEKKLKEDNPQFNEYKFWEAVHKDEITG
jgi:hypothetical protein